MVPQNVPHVIAHTAPLLGPVLGRLRRNVYTGQKGVGDSRNSFPFITLQCLWIKEKYLVFQSLPNYIKCCCIALPLIIIHCYGNKNYCLVLQALPHKLLLHLLFYCCIEKEEYSMFQIKLIRENLVTSIWYANLVISKWNNLSACLLKLLPWKSNFFLALSIAFKCLVNTTCTYFTIMNG